MIDDKDFYDLKVRVEKSVSIFENFIENTAIYRADKDKSHEDYKRSLCSKIDVILKQGEKFLNQIEIMNDRCMSKISDYESFKQHISEHKENKKFYKDKRFVIICGMVLAVFSAFITMIVNLNKDTKILQDERHYRATQTDKHSTQQDSRENVSIRPDTFRYSQGYGSNRE